MIASEMVSRIRSSIRIVTADSDLTDRAILSELRSVRNKYVYQKLNKRIGWDSATLFTPLKVELIEVPLADFCEYQSECTVARSKYKLPKISEGIFSSATQGLYTLDRKNKFLEVSPTRYQNILQLNLPRKNTFYWFFNEYLWVSDSSLESVILPAFLEAEAPKEFSLDCDESESECPINPLKQEFKTYGGGTESDIINAVVQYYSNTFKRSVADNSSDEMDQSK